MNNQLASKLQKETVYLKNSEEDCLVKCTPSGHYFVKFKGETEYLCTSSARIVADCFLACKEVTKEEYESF